MRRLSHWSRFNCGTGVSREDVMCHTPNLMVHKLASSRLKPVLLNQTVRRLHWPRFIVGPALAGKTSGVTPHP